MKAIWRDNYKPMACDTAAKGVEMEPQDPSDDPHQRLRDYMHKRRRLNSSQDPYDQFEAYLGTDPIPRDDSFDPIAYWIDRYSSDPLLN